MKKSSLIAWAALLSLFGCSEADESSPPDEPACKVESTGGVEMCFRSFGNEQAPKTMVVLPGGPGLGSGYLTSLIEDIASDSLRVVTYDPRGVGNSTTPAPPSYSLADYADDLEAVRVKLGVEQMTVLAHSWSSLIVYHYLESHPGHINALIIASGVSPQDWQNAEAQGLIDSRIYGMQASGLLPPTPPDEGNDCNPSFSATLPAYFSNWLDPDNLPIEDELRFVQCAVDVRDGSKNTLATTGYNYLSAVQTYTGPLMPIFGDNDPQNTGVMAANISGAFSSAALHNDEFISIPDTGHYPWFEDRETFLGHINGFFAANP